MSTRERELNSQATTSGPPPQRVEGTPPSTNTHMFELDEHYMVQKEFEAGSTVILWHLDHTSGMRVVGIGYPRNKLHGWYLGINGVGNSKRDLKMCRTPCQCPIVVPSRMWAYACRMRCWYGRHQICVLMQHLRSLDLGKQ